MATLRTLASQFSSLIHIKPACGLKAGDRLYSIFPKSHVAPIFDKKVQKELEESGEIKVIAHLPTLPAFTPHTSSEFYDATVNKFINYLLRDGNKELARQLVFTAFEQVKKIQIERYHKASPEEQAEIELDPKVVLHKAVENTAPVLELLRMKRGGITYMVPVPITEKRSRFLAMNWLLEAGRDKDPNVRMTLKLAHELIDAYNNTGRVVRKKQELYRQCEANRSFAHFRWT